MQVLEHEHQRAVGGRPPQEAERKLEQATLRRGADRRRRPGGRLDEVRKQPGQLESAGRQQIRAARGVESARVVAQRLDERPERQPAVLDVDAAADQRGRPGRSGARDELGGEASLPDPGLAPHHEHLGPARGRRRQSVFEPPQLLLAAHETAVRCQLDNES